MLDFLRLFLHVLAAPFRTQAQLEAEVTLLRHQLNVLRRQAPSKPRLTGADRLLLVWLWRLFPSLRSAITIVQPDTVLRWHRSGFRLYWRWKSRSRSGRPRVPVEVRSLIRLLSMENPLWGAPRIHGELLKLGIEVAQSTVAKYMSRHSRRIEPISRSVCPFCQGERGAVGRSRIPMAARRRVTALPYEASLSRMRY